VLVTHQTTAGETFRDAAVRGLQEELGITGAVLPQQPLGAMHRRSLVAPGSYLDNELVESYELKNFNGEVRPAGGAAAAVAVPRVEHL
jgi:ADP-ribose pyrophosphatase YjhB (NUDIX family)